MSKISETVQNSITVGQIKYQKLPTGLCNRSDIFQGKMKKLLNGLEYLRAYIDDLLIISNSNFEDHQNNVKIFLLKVKPAGFKINAEKSLFARDNLEYLGFIITRQHNDAFTRYSISNLTHSCTN